MGGYNNNNNNNNNNSINNNNNNNNNTNFAIYFNKNIIITETNVNLHNA